MSGFTWQGALVILAPVAVLLLGFLLLGRDDP